MSREDQEKAWDPKRSIGKRATIKRLSSKSDRRFVDYWGV